MENTKELLDLKMPPEKFSFSMNLYDFRKDDRETSWNLPPWGYPLGIGVNPLFLEVDGRIRPVGTAFNLGGGVNITVTAFHCVETAIRHEPILYREFIEKGILKNGILKRANLFILRNYNTEEGIHFSFVPLEHVAGGPPADVVFCASNFQAGSVTMNSKLSFQLPLPGELIHSVGYCAFRFPEEGIPLAQTKSFDWERDYSHELRVIESSISHVFTREYARGYLQGPCFAFRGRLGGGMSGGPVFDLRRNVIFGVNSAAAFDEDMSLASLLFPYVLSPITFGANIFGDPRFRMNSTQNIIQMLEFGSIASDGSYSELVYQPTPDGIVVSTSFGVAFEERVFENLRGMQIGERPQKYVGPVFVRRQQKDELM